MAKQRVFELKDLLLNLRLQDVWAHLHLTLVAITERKIREKHHFDTQRTTRDLIEFGVIRNGIALDVCVRNILQKIGILLPERFESKARPR